MTLLKLTVLIIAIFVFLYALVGAVVYSYRMHRYSIFRTPPKLFEISREFPPPGSYTETGRKNYVGLMRMLVVAIVSMLTIRVVVALW